MRMGGGGGGMGSGGRGMGGAFCPLPRALGRARLGAPGEGTSPRIVGAALRQRLPTSGYTPQWAAGALVAYSPDPVAVVGRHAEYVDKVLRGATPADLSIENPGRFVLTLNLKTAREPGLTIPPAMLARADHVIH
ncbi:MAG TPA: ABC transporter substrate binding protein [Vicinamibacteria bacterium]|nr:ABC transporter substrate binding protein [Vicinamibacteria bacterium]